MLLKNFTFLPGPQAPPNPKPLIAEPSGLSHTTRSPKPREQMSNGERETSISGPSFQGTSLNGPVFSRHSHNYLRHASPAHKLTVQQSGDLLSCMASFTVSVHTAVPKRSPLSNKTSPHETNICSSMYAQTLGWTYLHLPGLRTFLWTGSMCAQGTMQTPYMGGPFCHPSPPHEGSICECWTRGPGNGPFHTVPKHYCREGKVAGLTFRIQSTAGLWGQEPECLNLCLSRKGASLRTDTII